MIYRKRRRYQFLYRKRKGNKIYPPSGGQKRKQAKSGPNIKALAEAVKARDGVDVLSLIRTPEFNELMDNAYNDPSEYHIEEFNGRKIMVVKGSVGTWDHMKNAAALLGKVVEKTNNLFKGTKSYYDFGKYLTDTATRLDAVAQAEKPDIITGHSRGGAAMSYMTYKDTEYLTLDGAMIIGSNSEHIYNILSKPSWWDMSKDIIYKVAAGAVKDAVVAATITDVATLEALAGVGTIQAANFVAENVMQVADIFLNVDHEGDEYRTETNKEDAHRVWKIPKVPKATKEQIVEAVEGVDSHQKNTTELFNN